MVKQDYKINEQKINQWLSELEEDRTKYFNDVKSTSTTDKDKESKIKSLEAIQKQLLYYKKILNKEKEQNE